MSKKNSETTGPVREEQHKKEKDLGGSFGEKSNLSE